MKTTMTTCIAAVARSTTRDILVAQIPRRLDKTTRSMAPWLWPGCPSLFPMGFPPWGMGSSSVLC